VVLILRITTGSPDGVQEVRLQFASWAGITYRLQPGMTHVDMVGWLYIIVMCHMLKTVRADSHYRSNRCQRQHRQRGRREASVRRCKRCDYVHRLKRSRDDKARAQLGAHLEHVGPRPCCCKFLSCNISCLHSR
jgi:hypothetical protein